MRIDKVYITDERGMVKEFSKLEEAEKEQDSLKKRSVRTFIEWYHNGYALVVTSGKP